MVSLEVVNWMSSASKEDLDQLVRLADERRHLLAKSGLSLGAAVWFDANSKGIIRGKITKINAKSVKVVTAEGRTWNVSPTFLHLGTI